MPNEENEWWRAYTQLLHFADGSVEVNVHEKDVPKIIEEAMRRGEMKGLQEAMELFRDEISQLTVIYGTSYIPERFLLKVGAKLTELKK